jgi:hypothetical protein
MATIDSTYFFAELNIAQKTDNAASITMFIDEHEEQLLTNLLGYALYKAYKAGILASTPIYTDIRDGKEYTNRSGILTKWKGLKFTDGNTAKKSLIANYVYWHWMQNEVTVTTGSGEKRTNNQNSVDASAAHKMTRAWNQMVKWNWELIEFLLSNESSYPEFIDHYSRIPISILKKQNVLGI